MEPLLVLLILLPVLFRQVPWAISGTMQFGYFFVRTEWLRNTFDVLLPELSRRLQEHINTYEFIGEFDAWKAKVDVIQPSLWPLSYGGVVRDYGAHTLLDIAAASHALLHLTELDRSASDLANDRAGAFELQVQAILNDSDWRPPTEISSVRGKTLRVNGEAVTDIDAIGVKEKTLLLVSCKSLIYDREYDRGNYRVIRNAQSTIEKAIVDWKIIVERLKKNPVGSNFGACKEFCVD